jgi:hypothetical protein
MTLGRVLGGAVGPESTEAGSGGVSLMTLGEVIRAGGC